MRFTALRLAGFKSFVEPTELRILPGLTGVVGPNGCGKSNILEALRWVMGAGSAKALRADGMDDVIFAGAGDRPARNLAEVSLAIDNTDEDGPAAFADKPWIEVTRRIERGAGSIYRINGAEARARDVQLLFADASTGANSPAMVRQGQISELIAAKPENRRRVLEEAAGVAGLHGRRREAELKLAGAQANLARIEAVRAEMEGQLARQRREARQAARYRALSAEIRTLREAIARADWLEARSTVERGEGDVETTTRAVAEATAAAARAATAVAQIEAAAPAMREEAAFAAAGLHRLDIERDRLDRAAAAAAAALARLAEDRARIAADRARETQIGEDALAALARLDQELAAAAAAGHSPERLQELEVVAAEAEARREEAESAIETLAARIAAAKAASEALALRSREAAGRLERNRQGLREALDQQRAASPMDPRLDAAERRLEQAEEALACARDARDAAERRRDDAVRREAETRRLARAADDRLAGLDAEARGLARLLGAAGGGADAPVVAKLRTEPGLEAAVAAALGDDVLASLDPAAPVHWRNAAAADVAWPTGAEPIAARVTAPGVLDARLAHVAVVDRADGPRLQGCLSPGTRLVSREGDLWRWDGFTMDARAPRPAQVRLEQSGRAATLVGEMETARKIAEAAREAHAERRAALADAEADGIEVRGLSRAAEARLADARGERDGLRTEEASRQGRAAAISQTIARLEGEQVDLAAQAEAARAAAERAPPDPAATEALTRARAAAGEARSLAQSARAARDGEATRLAALARREEEARREKSEWEQRSRAAGDRLTALDREAKRVTAELASAARAPERLVGDRQRLLDERAAAEARRASAADALAAGDAARLEAERAARAADAEAGRHRESRAGAAARRDAALARLASLTEAYERLIGACPTEPAPGGADSPPADQGMLAALERQREGLGAVNLRAEDEAADLAARLAGMNAEIADLEGALRRLRAAIAEINRDAGNRMAEAFAVVDHHFRSLFTTLFQGGEARLALVDSDDPLAAGLEIHACPPGKRMAVMSLMSGGEQALTAIALIFAVFLANPAPACVLDEVDAPLDDANTERFCDLLDDMRHRAATRFLVITHNPLTMSRMDRLYGVTMRERGVSQLVSVDLTQAEAMAAR